MLDSSPTAIHTTSLLVLIWAHSGVFLAPLGALVGCHHRVQGWPERRGRSVAIQAWREWGSNSTWWEYRSLSKEREGIKNLAVLWCRAGALGTQDLWCPTGYEKGGLFSSFRCSYIDCVLWQDSLDSGFSLIMWLYCTQVNHILFSSIPKYCLCSPRVLKCYLPGKILTSVIKRKRFIL